MKNAESIIEDPSGGVPSDFRKPVISEYASSSFMSKGENSYDKTLIQWDKQIPEDSKIKC